LPSPLQFFTGNIGLHHIHHLNPKIPSYNLPRAQDECELFQGVPKLSLLDGIRAVRLKLWDENAARLVTWAEVKGPPTAAADERTNRAATV
jgi:omega-6 fatty acid desaturase (delta-12 desaturase)